ncbi:MAG: hypothetical protein KME26_16955 [Oscillatoria princeps RMCB-10]|nr:hypothetical protein [Oscillatoria princeps RMCB-10]
MIQEPMERAVQLLGWIACLCLANSRLPDAAAIAATARTPVRIAAPR